MIDRPNLLIINCHDLGQHISPYGVKTVNTPALEEMAGNGVVFSKSFCTSPGCSPSRAAIFTGRYPHATGVHGLTHGLFKWKMNRNEVHLAQMMSRSGYDTSLVGGFHEHSRDDMKRLGYKVYGNGGYMPGLETASLAADYLKAAKSAKKPFYLCVGFFEPHRPYNWHGIKPDSSKGVYIPGYIPNKTKEEKNVARKEFADLQGSIRRMDESVGKILCELRKSGLYENTAVMFMTDHGIAMPRAKCTIYDPGIETALIVQAPCWGVGEGKKLEGLVSNVDYVPTILEACGIRTTSAVQGKSFLSYMRGGKEHRDRIFAEKSYHRIYDPMRCIRTKKYKLIANFEYNTTCEIPSDIADSRFYAHHAAYYASHRKEFELYDLENDRWEQNNLFGDKKYAGIEKKLRAELFRWMKETGDPLLKGPIESIYFRDMLTKMGE
ncbi:MAG: hypothetical protein A2X48_02045 [Lentisphaerae bacterium GWF2_49_21]|nr:MAG: hypothetical protein A2X48_02045 [Lentisphaerae bacterium GWF2_49_21]